MDDTPYVVVGDDKNSFSLNSLHCKPEQPKRALELSKGDPITVWGGTNEIMGSPVLEQCSW